MTRIAPIGEAFADRHEAIRHLLRTLQPNPNLTGVAADIAAATWDQAVDAVDLLPDGPELSAGLRKLREAKDCFVLAHLTSPGRVENPVPNEPTTEA